MKQYYGIESTTLKELLSYRGAVLFHDNYGELEFLFEKGLRLGTLRIVDLPKTGLGGRSLLPLRRHPDMAALEWPLRKEDFRLDLR